MRPPLLPPVVLGAALVTIGPLALERGAKPALASADIDAIATLLNLEDTRTFDETKLQRLSKSPHPEVRRRAIQAIARIADMRGAPLLRAARHDRDVDVAATAVWAAGQLRDPGAIDWLAETLISPKTPAPIAREAATGLGKIRFMESRSALDYYLSSS